MEQLIFPHQFGKKRKNYSRITPRNESVRSRNEAYRILQHNRNATFVVTGAVTKARYNPRETGYLYPLNTSQAKESKHLPSLDKVGAIHRRTSLSTAEANWPRFCCSIYRRLSRDDNAQRSHSTFILSTISYMHIRRYVRELTWKRVHFTCTHLGTKIYVHIHLPFDRLDASQDLYYI